MATYLNIETHRILPGIKCDGQRILQASKPHLTAYCADNIDIIRVILNYEGKTIRSVYTTCGVVEQTEVVIHILHRCNRYTFKSGKMRVNIQTCVHCFEWSVIWKVKNVSKPFETGADSLNHIEPATEGADGVNLARTVQSTGADF